MTREYAHTETETGATVWLTRDEMRGTSAALQTNTPRHRERQNDLQTMSERTRILNYLHAGRVVSTLPRWMWETVEVSTLRGSVRSGI